MVYSTINPAPQSYRLWHRFSMPTSRGSVDAVAVEAYVAHELNSAYTFLLQHIVLLVWSLLVLAGVVISTRQHEKSHPYSSITKQMWARRSSPFDILNLTFKQFRKSKHRSWMILFWVFLALAFLVMKYAIPVAFARYIIIDNAAPVAPLAIYVPSYEGVDWNNLTTILSVVSLEGPSAFRAMGSVDSVNSTTLAKSFVSIDQPEILTKDPISGDPNQRMTYRYVVTGIDFGLQKYPDLILNVEGSCETEYGWYNGTKKSSDSTAPLDVYYLFNNASYEEWVSLDDGPSPVANFVLGPRPGLLSNFTWAAVISSVNRTSCSTGTDPWYLTVPNAPGTFSVKPGRPALSCWQNDVWSFRGVNSSVTELTAPALPGLDLPESLQDIFARNLANPKIPALGMRLGASALKSATNAFSGVFNASSSSVYADLERLVFASYIATVNTLTETTLFAPNSGIKNDALDDNGQPQPGVEEFVIWSKDVITLSVKALIIIPVLAGLLWMIFFGVLLLPIPEIVSLSLPAEKGPNGNPAEVDEEENGESGEESTTEKVIGSALEEVVLLGTQSTSTSFS